MAGLPRSLSHLALIVGAFGLPVAALAQTAPPVAARQQAVGFSHPTVARDATRYETWLKANVSPAAARKGRDARIAAEKVLAGGADARAAARGFSDAVVIDGKDAEAWLGLARALLAIKPDANGSSERYDLPVNASAAAYIAYQRATTTALEGAGAADARRRPEAALLLAAGDRRPEGEPRARRQRRGVARSYDKLRAEHGFRIVDYKVENDAAQPRLCMQFSESLPRGQADFAKFVSVDGKDPQSVTAENRQLCVEGLAHGKRYEVQVRAGLPSDIGRDPAQDRRDRRLRPRPRAARCASRARATCCRAAASRAFPSSPSTPRRSRSRSTASATAASLDRCTAATSRSRCRATSSSSCKDKTGAQRLHRHARGARTKLNEEVTTAVPVAEADRRAEARRLRDDRGHGRRQEGDRDGNDADARRSGSSSPISASPPSPATTASTPSCARSPATDPIGRRQRAPRRPQQRGARHRQDRRRAATSASTPA